jgi:hypothetical protein
LTSGSIFAWFFAARVDFDLAISAWESTNANASVFGVVVYAFDALGLVEARVLRFANVNL